MRVLAFLALAALLEIFGDVAMRAGLVRSPWWFVVGAGGLITYGIVVNANRSIDFGRLLGAYIAVFFVMSQIVSVAVFQERLPASRFVGGLFIVIGGVIVLWGTK